MLIRLAVAIQNKALMKEIERSLGSVSDIQIKHFSTTGIKKTWQALVRSCADIFLISDSKIPKPMESEIAILNNLPEKPITIVLHGNDSPEDHAQLVAAGADTVLYSKIPSTSLIEAIESIIESRRQYYVLDRYDRAGRLKPAISDFVSDSEQMQMFMDEVRQVVSSNATLLILGETGVGKEHLAKAIHAESQRSSGPFVAVNTAALPEQLLESELFGHEQGAFTGAIRSRRGAFEMAHNGTIFLDEIGDMPLHLQSKLLRVLQDYEVVPVGGEDPVWVDVRVIAATNKNLELDIGNGTFRMDLFYRLSVVSLTIPPLRERKEDIAPLISTFIKHFRKRIGRDVDEISEATLDVLSRYNWPGNVRELMNVIERAMLLCKTNRITLKNLPANISKAEPANNGSDGSGILDRKSWENKTLHEVTRDAVRYIEFQYLDMVLQKTKGRVGRAAEMAGIHPRGLFNKMKELKLKKEDYKR